jgi:hypothetical protein
MVSLRGVAILTNVEVSRNYWFFFCARAEFRFSQNSVSGRFKFTRKMAPSSRNSSGGISVGFPNSRSSELMCDDDFGVNPGEGVMPRCYP